MPRRSLPRVLLPATVCCLLLFSDAPIQGDYRVQYGNKWQVAMFDSPCAEPGCFCMACLCLPCANYKMRQDALNGDISNYKCCQGYMDNRCFTAGTKGDKGSAFCMCLEAFCCEGCSVSATRQLVMDTRDIQPDPCDNRIIRFNNCLFYLSCICDILACLDASFQDASLLIDLIQHAVFACTAACMTAQTHRELKAGAAQFNFAQVQIAQQQGSWGQKPQPHWP